MVPSGGTLENGEHSILLEGRASPLHASDLLSDEQYPVEASRAPARRRLYPYGAVRHRGLVEHGAELREPSRPGSEQGHHVVGPLWFSTPDSGGRCRRGVRFSRAGVEAGEGAGVRTGAGAGVSVWVVVGGGFGSGFGVWGTWTEEWR